MNTQLEACIIILLFFAFFYLFFCVYNICFPRITENLDMKLSLRRSISRLKKQVSAPPSQFAEDSFRRENNTCCYFTNNKSTGVSKMKSKAKLSSLRKSLQMKAIRLKEEENHHTFLKMSKEKVNFMNLVNKNVKMNMHLTPASPQKLKKLTRYEHVLHAGLLKMIAESDQGQKIRDNNAAILSCRKVSSQL